ncbi:hypothetical protein CF95_gp115 [Erwinia phage PhiEaH1]|uniref:LamG domain-containing protein n=1 Tax=Erwinia phage PhiEaH1 TaxID=1401669 RepID=W8CZE8_9CAUD|nr:hypothetical protein CF95_gp115 [Erwinia phage PhiEaH1]AGX01837.1 hypothetical protein [Erwinia phage PhiEaH1]
MNSQHSNGKGGLMLESMTMSNGTGMSLEPPILRIPLESSLDTYVKDGYEDFVGMLPASVGTIGSRESRGGLDLSQDISIKFSDNVFSGAEWTMSWWMYPENAIDWHNVGSTEVSSSSQNTMLIQYNTSTYQGYFLINYPSGTGQSEWYRSKLTLTQNTWNHFALTMKNNVLTSYKNGVKVATLNTRVFTGFGKYNWAVSQNKDRRGLMSNLMFFDKALSAADVLKAMAIYTVNEE